MARLLQRTPRTGRKGWIFVDPKEEQIQVVSDLSIPVVSLHHHLLPKAIANQFNSIFIDPKEEQTQVVPDLSIPVVSLHHLLIPKSIANQFNSIEMSRTLWYDLDLLPL